MPRTPQKAVNFLSRPTEATLGLFVACSGRMVMKAGVILCVTILGLIGGAHAQSPADSAVPVTPDNFVRAETDHYFGVSIEHAGGIGKFRHDRVPAPVDKQIVVRGSLDTLYSTGVWDLDAGPLTVTLPDAGRRMPQGEIVGQCHNRTPAS